jgi:hypothetical protein
MSGLARIKINGFDFDSAAPINGVVIDEAKSKAYREFIHGTIHMIAALNVVAAGAWVCKWWYNGGFTWAKWLFIRYAPELFNMITNGQVQ